MAQVVFYKKANLMYTGNSKSMLPGTLQTIDSRAKYSVEDPDPYSECGSVSEMVN